MFHNIFVYASQIFLMLVSLCGGISSGLIGRSWSMVFVSAGYNVTLFDIIPEQVTNALSSIQQQLGRLQDEGLLRGSKNAQEQFALIEGHTDLQQALKGAVYVQVKFIWSIVGYDWRWHKLLQVGQDHLVLIPWHLEAFTNSWKSKCQQVIQLPSLIIYWIMRTLRSIP